MNQRLLFLILIIIASAGGYFFGHYSGYNSAGYSICTDKGEMWFSEIGRCMSKEEFRKRMYYFELKLDDESQPE